LFSFVGRWIAAAALTACFAQAQTGVHLRTYLGGSGVDRIHDVAADSAGRLWVVGETTSTDSPGDPAAGSAEADGSVQAFVVRLEVGPDGWRYGPRFLIGGSGEDRARAVVVSGARLWVLGETASPDIASDRFVGTARGEIDLFAALFDLSDGLVHRGTALFGGGGTETIADALDEGGDCVSLAGTTSSSGLGSDTTIAGGFDAFVASACVGEQAPTVERFRYFGGVGRETVATLARTGDGALCLTGSTSSNSLPLAGALGDERGAGSEDGYLVCRRDGVVVGAGFAGGGELRAVGYPGSPAELLAVSVSDSEPRLFASADAASTTGTTADFPGAGAVALAGLRADLSAARDRGYLPTGGARLAALSTDGACALAWTTLAGQDSLLRLCPTDARLDFAQTLPFLVEAPVGFERAGLAATSPTGDFAAWGEITPLPPDAVPPASLGAPQTGHGGGDRDGFLYVGRLPYLTPGAIVSAADFQARNAAAPGEMLAVFGERIGPADLIVGEPEPGGSLPTTLGGVRVLVDDEAAPLNLASAGQLGVVMPFSIDDGRGRAVVVVETNGAPSNPVALPVAAAQPALFTSDSSGAGQAAALNQDFSANSAASPAAVGQGLSLFLTGCGSTSPPGRAGYLAPSNAPFPELTQQAEVFFGEVQAPVLYAGAAPGLLEGLCQVNAQIPESAPLGAEIPLEVRIGGVPTRPGPTVALREAIPGGGGGGPGGPGPTPVGSGQCSELCGGLRAAANLLDVLLGFPSSAAQKGEACGCFSMPFPARVR